MYISSIFDLILFSILLVLVFLLGVYIERATKLSKTLGKLAHFFMTHYREKQVRYYMGENEWDILLKTLDYYADWDMPFSYKQYVAQNGYPLFSIIFTLKPQIDKSTVDIAQIANRVKLKLEQILLRCGRKWTIFPDYNINNDIVYINLIYVEFQSDIEPYSKEIELIKLKRQKELVDIGRISDDELNRDLNEISKEEDEI